MNLAEKYGIDTSKEHKTACPRCRRNGRDRAGNNLHVYGLGNGAHCWSCGFTLPSDEHLEKMGWVEDEKEDEVTTKLPITKEEREQVKQYTTTNGQGYRGIREEINKYFGVRFKCDEDTGKPIAQYYPATVDSELTGYKIRHFPKSFHGPIGQTGKDCDLFGQHRFKSHSKICLIVGGETKVLAAYQMMRDNIAARGKLDEWEIPAVVSPMIGESGAASQIKEQYKFFSQFNKVIICMDADDAGEAAVHKIAKVLPKRGNVFVMKMRHKDADIYIEKGCERDFVTDYLNAKQYISAGLVGSGDLPAKMLAEADVEKVSFPDIMEEVNEMTGGGIALSRIVNIGAGSGLGKTTWVRVCTEHWAFHSPYTVGVVSMEETAGQYGISMLSHYIGFNINSISDKVEKRIFMKRNDIVAANQRLFFREDGSHRFFLVDDRDGTIDDLKAVVEELVVSCGVKILVLDPLQDILDGLDIDQQAVFLKWQKGLIRSHGVTFININHVRKSQGGGKQNSAGAMISEEDFQGTSTIFKSGALNILLVRDKMNPDPIIRNTTLAFISKNRDNSETGPAGEFYYDIKTKRLYNKKQWIEKNGTKEF